MLLAVAPISASPNDVIEWLLVTLGVVLVFVVLGGLIIRFARNRRRRQLEMISSAVVLWGIIAAASVSFYVMRKMNWDAEVQQRIYGGYYDPNDTGDRPNVPVAMWSILGGCYAAMIGWTATGKPLPENSSLEAGERKI